MTDQHCADVSTAGAAVSLNGEETAAMTNQHCAAVATAATAVSLDGEETAAMTNQHCVDVTTATADAAASLSRDKLEEILKHCDFITIQDAAEVVAVDDDDDDDDKATNNDRDDDIYVVPNLAYPLDEKLLESIGSDELFVEVKNTLQESTLYQSGLTIDNKSATKHYYYIENSVYKKLKSLCVSVVYSGVFVGAEHHPGKLDVDLRRLSNHREPIVALPSSSIGIKNMSTSNTTTTSAMGLITVDLELENKIIESGLFELTVSASSASSYSIRIEPGSFARPFELEMKRQAAELVEKQQNLNDCKSKYKTHLYHQQLLERKIKVAEELLRKDSDNCDRCKGKSDQIEEELDNSNGTEEEDSILLQKLQALSIESKHLDSRRQHRKEVMKDLVNQLEDVTKEIATILKAEERMKKEVKEGAEIIVAAKKSLELCEKRLRVGVD